MNNRKKSGWIFGILGLLLALSLVSVWVLYRYNVIPHRKYTGEDFGISAYRSTVDRDGDGIDDQTDILRGAYDYVASGPIYKSRYYEGGWPDDGYGVCTDVVARALLAAGYNLQEMVDIDRAASPESYRLDEEPDTNIDFRRVRNLLVYFRRNAISLSTDPHDLAQWQGGDIVVFEGHIGIVSDHRNYKGISFVIHHGSVGQMSYEEDILEIHGEILGHFRLT